MILGIGTDLVDCRRIEKLILKYENRFLNRIFTEEERARINIRHQRILGYAKLFAIKESVLKALGTGLAKGVTWHDITITREPWSAPQVQLKGEALLRLTSMTPPGYRPSIHVSVSDEWPYAQSFLVISGIPTLA